MKSNVKIPLLVTTSILLIVTVAFAAQMLSVQVRSGQLRDKPGFLSKIVSELPYGDRVDLKSEKGDWRRVTSSKSGKTGWMHSSALTEQEIVLNPTDKDVETAAKSDELALAGKGFNKQVEEEYQQDKKLDYSQVNEMEALSVSPQQVQSFMKAGNLGKGGAQ